MSGLFSNGYFDAVVSRLQNPAMLSGLGARGVSLVQKNIRDGDWQENAPLTKELKGGNPKPLMDEGHLVASMQYRVEENKRTVVYTIRPGANVVHNGGIIRPVNTKYLAIPASRETKKLMGIYGLTPRTCIEGMKKANYTVFFRTGVVLYLPPNAKKGTKAKALFILKTSVTLPARLYMRLPQDSLEILASYLLRFAAKMEA